MFQTKQTTYLQLVSIIDALQKNFSSEIATLEDGFDIDLIVRINDFAYRYYSNSFLKTFNSKSTEKPPEWNFDDLKKALRIPDENITWDRCWSFKNTSAHFAKLYGQYFVTKAGESKLIEPEKFIINDDVIDDKTSVNIKINIFEKLKVENHMWYMLSGNKSLSYYNIIRFYFSFNYDVYQDAIDFIADLREALNDNFIPFELKFEVVFSERYDNMVLYTQQEHYFIVLLLIHQLYSSHNKRGIFRSNHPLFTKQLYDGISFAEDPNQLRQSFGSNRAALLSDIFIQYHEQKRKNKSIEAFFIDKIRQSFITKGLNDFFDIEDFFRNPNSKFPYDFDVQKYFENRKNFSKYSALQNNLNPILFAAYQIGKIICNKAIIINENNKTKCNWTYFIHDEFDEDSTICRLVGEDFASGKLGIAFFLANLSSFFNKDFVFQIVCELILDELYETKEMTIYKEIRETLNLAKSFNYNTVIPKKNSLTINQTTYKLLENLFTIESNIDEIVAELMEKEYYSLNGQHSFNPTLNDWGLSKLGLALLEIYQKEPIY